VAPKEAANWGKPDVIRWGGTDTLRGRQRCSPEKEAPMRDSGRQWAIVAVGLAVFVIAAVIAFQHPGCDFYKNGYCGRFGGGPAHDLAWVAWLFGVGALAIAVIAALVLGNRRGDS
jgi:hypothetical protein